MTSPPLITTGRAQSSVRQAVNAVVDMLTELSNAKVPFDSEAERVLSTLKREATYLRSFGLFDAEKVLRVRDLTQQLAESAELGAHFERLNRSAGGLLRRRPTVQARLQELETSLISLHAYLAERERLAKPAAPETPPPVRSRPKVAPRAGPAIAKELAAIVPPQKVAPARFAFQSGVLCVDHVKATPSKDAAGAAAAAQRALIASGDVLLVKLRHSNCDSRVIELIDGLQAKLASSLDIVDLGIANVGCDMMAAAFATELPSAVVAMLQTYSRGIAMYVAQFPDWVLFADNAAAVDLTREDVASAVSAAKRSVEQLTAAGGIVDPEVPKTITVLTELVSDPARAGRRAVFAVVRTLQNLVAKIFEYGGKLLDAPISGAIEGLKDGSKTLVKGAALIMLLRIAIDISAGVSPVASGLTGSGWMKTASEIVEKNIAEFD